MPSHAPEAMDGRTALTLRVLTVATFIVILNNTIMVNALPSLMESMRVDAQTVQWLVTGFMLTMAVVIPTTGWFLQRVGRRTAFITAMSVFSAGTALGAVAPTFEILLMGRIVQATGTAVMMPLLMSTVLLLVPAGTRGRVMGNVSLAISVAPAMGPTVSGVILSFGSWRWIFVVVFPLAVTAAVVGAWLLDPRRLGEAEAGERDRLGEGGRMDPISVLLTIVGFGGLVYGLSRVGGADVHLLGLPTMALVIGVVGVSLFAWRQMVLIRTSRPVLDLRVLRSARYRLAVTIMAVSFMALMGAMVMLPLYFQDARGMSTLQAGLMLMPGGLAMGLLGPPVGRLYDRVGAAPLVIPGSLALAGGLGMLAWSTNHGPWWLFLVLHLFMSAGLAFVFTPMFTAGLSSLRAPFYEHGSALLGTLQQVAAAAGTALVITVMSGAAARSAATGVEPAAALGQGVEAGLVVATVLAAVVAGLSLLFLRVGDDVTETEADRDA